MGIEVSTEETASDAAGAAAADISSYFAFILRVVQELAYLYGFGEFNVNEDEVDSETMNQLLVFIGVMFGVQGAVAALNKFADAFAKQIAKNLAKKALMNTVYYPIIKSIAKKVGVHMTKQIFADTVAVEPSQKIKILPACSGLAVAIRRSPLTNLPI